VKQFSKWLVVDRRTDENRLAHLQGGNVKTDVRRRRRELNDDEIRRLLKATRVGGVFSRLTGEQRRMLYITALGTGLRASELASLTSRSFDLDNTTPTVTILPEHEKAGRGDTLPLSPDVVAIIKPWLTQHAPDAPLWPGKWAKHKQGSLMIEHDLDAARESWIDETKEDEQEKERRRKSTDFLRYRNADGELADFHSLRHCFLSRLGRSGVSPKTMQRLARHSTVTLTIDRYGHASLHDLKSAMNMIAPLPMEVGDHIPGSSVSSDSQEVSRGVTNYRDDSAEEVTTVLRVTA
jgi:integrase